MRKIDLLIDESNFKKHMIHEETKIKNHSYIIITLFKRSFVMSILTCQTKYYNLLSLTKRV